MEVGGQRDVVKFLLSHNEFEPLTMKKQTFHIKW